MLSERDIELAHPEAFDFVFGNLPPARRAEFDRHLADCRPCQSVIEEYREIGGIIKILPPHLEPPADLEDRTVAAMVAALDEHRAEPDHRPDAEDQAATRVFPIHEVHHAPAPETLIQPRLQLRPAAEDATQPRPTLANQPAPDETAAVTRLPVWRRYPRRLASVVAVAAAIIAAAIVVPLSAGRSGPAQATVLITLRVTATGRALGFGAATGQAIARQDSSGSWDITLTVQHLKHFDPTPWYECWYVSRDARLAASAGTFLVPADGTRTFTMTSAVDPRQFHTMEITLQYPSNDGALGSRVILKGQSAVEQ